MNNNKNLYIIIGVVILLIIVLGVWMWQSGTPTANAPATTEIPFAGAPIQTSDTTGAINQDLKSIDLGNLDSDFQSIDRDLKSL